MDCLSPSQGVERLDGDPAGGKFLVKIGGGSPLGYLPGCPATGHVHERLPVGGRCPTHPVGQPGDPGWIPARRGEKLADEQTDFVEVGGRRPYDQRLECSGDELESQPIDLEKGLHVDPLGRPAVGGGQVVVADHEQAGAGEILGGERARVAALPMKDQQAAGVAPLMVQ